MKFVMSYSCGKDSALALHRMIQNGHQPIGLLVMINKEMERSWFHGVDMALLEQISQSLAIPVIPCICEGEQYHTALEEGLRKAKALGAQCCAFGDIDIEGHFDWCAERCRNMGMAHSFPLWQESREELTYELIRLGYRAVIKCVNQTMLPKSFLGKELSEAIVAQMKDIGIDICGENGEYHTVTVAGPIFDFPVNYRLGEILEFGDIAVVDILAAEA